MIRAIYGSEPGSLAPRLQGICRPLARDGIDAGWEEVADSPSIGRRERARANMTPIPNRMRPDQPPSSDGDAQPFTTKDGPRFLQGLGTAEAPIVFHHACAERGDWKSDAVRPRRGYGLSPTIAAATAAEPYRRARDDLAADVAALADASISRTRFISPIRRRPTCSLVRAANPGRFRKPSWSARCAPVRSDPTPIPAASRR